MQAKGLSLQTSLDEKQHLPKTLLIGFGGSVLLHLAVAGVVSNLWHPADEVLEVTLVDPVPEPTPTPVPSIVAKKVEPPPTPPPKIVKSTPIPTPTPKIVKPTPTPTDRKSVV